MAISLNPLTAYLAGAIIGDGNISNYVKSKKTDKSMDYRVNFDLSDKEYLFWLHSALGTLVSTASIPRAIKNQRNRLPRWCSAIRNKELHTFFSRELGIPKGKKSALVSIPEQILRDQNLRKHFLAGYFDTDGGFRRGSLGFTSASHLLLDQITLCLNSEGIICSSDSWTCAGKEFYGLIIRRSQINTFLNKFPFQNSEKLARIQARFPIAGVPERSNGTEFFAQKNVQA